MNTFILVLVILGIVGCVVFRCVVGWLRRRNARPVEHNMITGSGVFDAD